MVGSRSRACIGLNACKLSEMATLTFLFVVHLLLSTGVRARELKATPLPYLYMKHHLVGNVEEQSPKVVTVDV